MALRFRFDKRYPLLLRYILEKRGWTRTTGEDYHLWWRNSRFPEREVFSARSDQRINHFTNSGLITKKAGMIYFMKKYRKTYGSDVYNFMPPSLILSPRSEKPVLPLQLEENISKRIWIVKPSSSSQGRGIKLITDLNSLDLGRYYSDWKEYADRTRSNDELEETRLSQSVPNLEPVKHPRTIVVSQYIDNPYLIRGYKHDIRLYVLVTSYHPFTVHLYREGLVRFATKPYDVENSQLSGGRQEAAFKHLTNTSINKFNPMFKGKIDKESVNEMKLFQNAMFNTLGYGDLGKRTLRQLFQYFHREGVDYKPIWEEIKRIILLTLLPLTDKVPNTRAKCFELYGFDILLDAQLKPWLIEVNYSPSLALETVTDQSIKEPLLEDVIDTLQFEGQQLGGSSVNKTFFPWETAKSVGMSGNFEQIFPIDESTASLASEISSVVSTKQYIDQQVGSQDAELPEKSKLEFSREDLEQKLVHKIQSFYKK